MGTAVLKRVILQFCVKYDISLQNYTPHIPQVICWFCCLDHDNFIINPSVGDFEGRVSWANRVHFGPRVRLEFGGMQLSSDGGLLVMRELDDALGLCDLASAALYDCRRDKNTVHLLDGLFRQSVYGRLAGYEDVDDADRLALDPAMRQVAGGRAVDAQAASASQMGQFETETLVMP